MLARVQQNGDTDTHLFHELMYAAEFATKLTVGAFVASIKDDPDSHRYRCNHTLVRQASVGIWIDTLTHVCRNRHRLGSELLGPSQAFTRKTRLDGWQHTCVAQLHHAVQVISSDVHPIPEKVSLLHWFMLFAELRNKTRGHGAITPSKCAAVVPWLQKSITTLFEHNPIFDLPWVYLHRNLSGKYRVVRIGGDESVFSQLTTRESIHLPPYSDGIYVWCDQPRLVELIRTDLDVSDFFVPNGGFSGRTFELHSLITDDRRKGDGKPYSHEPSGRPASETEGTPSLVEVANVWCNIPEQRHDYVSRPSLEEDVRRALLNDRHPIVTLIGSGGIGKTSLTLTLLHEVALADRYEVIVWFSARDIDLTDTGPKIVQPKILTKRQICDEYVQLIGELVELPTELSTETVARHMRQCPHGGPTLFVFDNFETVIDPEDVYKWLDTNIRLPNKILITSRFSRTFQADMRIAVPGMENDEARALIHRRATTLDIRHRLDASRIDRIIEQSSGHPYVIKILLGSMVDEHAARGMALPLARREDILDALFERTYDNLAPLAQRTLLILSSWRSLVSQLVLEAALHGFSVEEVDPHAAIDELVRMSLVERKTAKDGLEFLEVPLTATFFGRKKLEVSPNREIIRKAVTFIQDSGPTKPNALKVDGYPRIRSLFEKTAMRVADGKMPIEKAREVLGFLASSVPKAWLLLADLEREVGSARHETRCVQRFIEEFAPSPECARAWDRLAVIYRRAGDVVGCCNAFLRSAEIRPPDLDAMSRMANYVNGRAEVIADMDSTQRGALLVPLAELMIPHMAHGSATDCSRVAWLYLHSGRSEEARHWTEEGLDRDPDHPHCVRLRSKLSGQITW